MRLCMQSIHYNFIYSFCINVNAGKIEFFLIIIINVHLTRAEERQKKVKKLNLIISKKKIYSILHMIAMQKAIYSRISYA